MRCVLIVVTVFCALSLQAIPQKDAASATAQRPPTRQIPCKTDENASMCYWTRGRLGVYNGNPSFRVWRIGTSRVVGIHSGPDAQSHDSLDGEHPEFPANVRKIASGLTEGHRIFADFYICPFAPEHPGEMQFGCIEAAKNMAVEK